MPTAKKPKVESADSFHPAENSSDDDDDDLFISVWDGQSTKKTSSNETSTTSKPKPLPNTTSTPSGSKKSKLNTSISDKNYLVTSVNNPSCFGVSPRKLRNQNSSDNIDLSFSSNDNGQTSNSGVDSNMHNRNSGGKNNSCSSTNDGNKPSCSGLSTSGLQNQDSIDDNDLNSSTNKGDHYSTAGIDSDMHIERSDSKNNLRNSPSDLDKPSCSGINVRDFVDLSLETDLCVLKNMFPSLDEDVLKSYLEIYQDLEECVRVVSNLLYGGVDDDDVYINEDVKHTASESTRNTDKVINTHEHKSPTSNHSYSPMKKESVDGSPGEIRLKDHDGSKSVTAMKSEIDDSDNHDSKENKAPLSSNSREITSNTVSSSFLRTIRRSPSSANKKQKPSSKETSLDVTLTTNGERESKSQKLDIKSPQMDTKPHASHTVPSNNTVQVGIDIRFGNNKAHPSMKRCVDRSIASKDMAKPYRGNTNVKASPNSHNPRSESSTDVKRTLDNSSDSSPSKRMCKNNSSPRTSTHNSPSASINVDARSSDLSTSQNSSDNKVTQSPSKNIQGRSSSHNSPSTSRYASTRSSDLRGSTSISRNSSNNPVTPSPSKKVQGQSSSYNSSPGTSTYASARSSDLRGSTSISRNSSNNPVTPSPSKKVQGQSSSYNSSPGTSTYASARSSDLRGSTSISRNSSDNPVTQSASKKTFGHSSTHESPKNSSRTDHFSTPSASRNSSEYSTTNSSPTRSQPRTLFSTDFSSVINSVSKRMLESQESLVSNPSAAEMASKKGKGPKFSAFPFTPPLDANEGLRIDWGDVVRNMNENQSTSATNTQPQITIPITTISGQSTGIQQETIASNDNQTMSTTVVKQESQNQSSSPTNATQNRSATGYLNPEQIVLVVEKSNTNNCVGLPSESQDMVHTSQQEELSAEEEVARQEMLDLQRDTEMLTKVCPESDPNYIFSRLEELKDKPNRVAIVNKELIENASTSGGNVENVIQKQKKVVWSWEDKKMRHIPFSRAESNIIESKYTKHNGCLVEVKFSAVTLVLWFNFNSMTLQETLRNKIRHVYRTESMEEIVPGKDDKREETGLSLPPLSNPETWHGHGSSTNNTSTATTRDLFEVLPGTSEFAHVDVLLKKSLPQAVIKKIKRVKNDWLERKYGIQRALLREKNGPGGINEMELFHGTRQTLPSVVWNSEEGFDMRYSADGMWGRGCYFAVHAAYSHNQFTHQYIHKQQRYYQIFLAHVLTGESINMNSDRSMRKPPLNVATGRHYDSVTGITQGHRIYVLYKNEASFPAYLITYTM